MERGLGIGVFGRCELLETTIRLGHGCIRYLGDDYGTGSTHETLLVLDRIQFSENVHGLFMLG